MRYLLAIWFVVVFSVSAGFANQGLNDVEKGIIQLEYIGRQVQAVENDLRIYYMTKLEDRPDVEPTGEVEELQKISSGLEGLSLPREISGLKPGLKAVINKLLDNCKGILKKDEKVRGREFNDFWNKVSSYSAQLQPKIDKYLIVSKIQDSFDLLNEEANLFTDNKNRDMFKKAASYIADRKYKEAASILKLLLPKYNNQPAEGSILVRLVDCYIANESPLRDEEQGEEYVLGLLTDFVNRKQYAFLIQRLYLQWRTLEQMQNNGASNWSNVPNDQYNQVLWGLVESIEKHIDQHPDDSWAKYQLLLLMDTPMIERFPVDYPYGNSVAVDYAFLNGMLGDKKETAGEESSTGSIKN